MAMGPRRLEAFFVESATDEEQRQHRAADSEDRIREAIGS